MLNQMQADLAALQLQLSTLKEDMDHAISDGKNFIEVKMIHLQIKELSRLIEKMKAAKDRMSA